MDAQENNGDSSDQNSSEKETQNEVLDVAVTKNIVQRVQKVKPGGVLERRYSLRLKNIPDDKRPYYGPDDRKRLSRGSIDDVCEEETDRKRQSSLGKENVSQKKMKQECAIDVSSENVERLKAEGGVPISSAPVDYDPTELVELEEDKYLKWTDYESFLVDSLSQKAESRVRETMRIFNKHYLQYVQEEESRCKKAEVNGSFAANVASNKGNPIADAKRSSKRPDLKAITKMLENNEILYPEKQFGHLPGIFVGRQFFSRAEMVAIGFHGHWLKGIDYIGKLSGNLKKHNGHTTPLAVAIVLSGQYEDDVDYYNEVVYTGQGGNNLLGNKRQIKDQEMVLGNLALKNNMEQSIPVRVIRGHKSAYSYTGKVYTYCGLYKVVDHWSDKGVSGFHVLKYRLKRLLGQPKVKIEQVYFEGASVSKVSHKSLGLVCEDISFGEENVRIPVTNLIDDPPIAPADFKYAKSIQVAKNVTIPQNAPGCKCKGNCTNSKSCSCARLNGTDFPYVHKDGGRLIEPKDVVYECGPGCGCGPNCLNRTSQQGIKYRLEVYRTENKGWAVRSCDFIPSGAPVCEYTGVLRRNDELDNVSENDYIFDIDCWHTMNGIGGRERRQGDVSAPANNPVEKVDDKMADSESEFCIDAGSCGNVARFINHSCEPNLFVQCVLSAHHDVRLARIVLFAADNIPPLQELSYDYGYALDSVIGTDGKLKQLPCYCGANECRGRLF